MTDSFDRVRIGKSGGVGRLTLDRAEAINALDLGMIRDLAATLTAWRDDPDVNIVVLDGAGDRGFCAGGDVRGLHAQLASGDLDAVAEYFRAEYALDAAIAEYPAPVVAIADGVTMGGGIGLAGHAAIRVVTERSLLAMPETRIGFTPDVGGSWLLARAPGRLGEYLALTGDTMNPADAIYAGFADHFVPSDRLDALRHALRTRADPQTPTELVLLFDETADPAPLQAARAWIDDAFSASTVPEIIDRLRQLAVDSAVPESGEVGPTPANALEALRERSPTALAVALEAIRAARGLPDVRAALEQEYGIIMWFAQTQPDMPEGIRAQLVDKDRAPRWQPARLDEVPDGIGAEALAHRPALPLWE